MPERKTLERAARAKREGKSPSTQAGAFVQEQIDHIRQGKHGATSTRQAIAIGLSEARRAGVKLPPPAPGKASQATRDKAKKDLEAGKHPHPADPTRARASTKALSRESSAAASPKALSAHAKQAASQRTAADRSASARKAAATKGAAGRSAAAKKAARTRAANRAARQKA